LDKGSSVASHLSNINGDITLTGSTVGRNVSTVNGDVSVMEGAVIKGDLIVEKPHGFFNGSNNSEPPTIIIGPGSRVEGVIKLEREVTLYISDSAEVGGVEGVMSMDDAVRFSGNRP
jgi:cytoskeletal protein CcmA (bactofilin family)